MNYCAKWGSKTTGWCSLVLPSCSLCGTHRSTHTHRELCRESRNAGEFWPSVSTQWAADDAEGWLLLYRSAFVLLSRAWSLEPCVLSRRQRDRCDLLASSSAGSWAIFTQAGRYGRAWVTDENPWGALDYGEWKIKRNHIGHRYKRSPLFLFYPSLFLFSSSLLGCNECGKTASPLKVFEDM